MVAHRVLSIVSGPSSQKCGARSYKSTLKCVYLFHCIKLNTPSAPRNPQAWTFEHPRDHQEAPWFLPNVEALRPNLQDGTPQKICPCASETLKRAPSSQPCPWSEGREQLLNGVEGHPWKTVACAEPSATHPRNHRFGQGKGSPHMGIMLDKSDPHLNPKAHFKVVKTN